MQAQKSKASPGHAFQKTNIEKCASSLKTLKMVQPMMGDDAIKGIFSPLIRHPLPFVVSECNHQKLIILETEFKG
jgi:hypothetical protein